MKVMKMLALPVMLFATVSIASAQESAKAKASEAKQDTKTAASNTGAAITDSWITLKVHSQFVPEDALKDSDIDVDTNNGVVTLNGTVVSDAGKARAVAIAKATDGVKTVTDNLLIVAAHDHTAAAREAGHDAANKTKEAAGTSGKAVTDGWVKSKIAAQYSHRGFARQERYRHRREEGDGRPERRGPLLGGQDPCDGDCQGYRRRQGRHQQPEDRSGREVAPA